MCAADVVLSKFYLSTSVLKKKERKTQRSMFAVKATVFLSNQIPSPIPRRFRTLQIPSHHHSTRLHPYHNPYTKSAISASSGNGNSNGDNGNGEDGELRKGNERKGFGIKWGQLLLDPDPDNVLAVGLTGLLTWASVQVVWQLLVVSLAIVVAALKYSLVAALLIFILIALL